LHVTFPSLQSFSKSSTELVGDLGVILDSILPHDEAGEIGSTGAPSVSSSVTSSKLACCILHLNLYL
jgi:hypothetical protein